MALTIGSTTLPTPKSVTYSYNKLWSQNTGRLDNGYFVGDLIAVKRKYEVTFPPLSPTQLSDVRTAINPSGGFASVTITDVGNGDNSSHTTTLDAYFGDLTVESYSWHNGIKYAINAAVSIIER